MKRAFLVGVLGLSLWGCNQGPREDDTVGVLPKPGQSRTASTGTEVGQRLPDFQLSLLGGGNAKLSDYAGKHLIVYVNSYT